MGHMDSAVVVDFEALDEMKFKIGYNNTPLELCRRVLYTQSL